MFDMLSTRTKALIGTAVLGLGIWGGYQYLNRPPPPGPAAVVSAPVELVAPAPPPSIYGPLLGEVRVPERMVFEQDCGELSSQILQPAVLQHRVDDAVQNYALNADGMVQVRDGSVTLQQLANPFTVGYFSFKYGDGPALKQYFEENNTRFGARADIMLDQNTVRQIMGDDNQ